MELNTALAELHDRVRVPALLRRRFGPEAFWDAVMPLVEGAAGFQLEEVGRSARGRPLRLVRFGDGPARVLLWTQMHGDEPTGTMAVADLLRLLAERTDEARVQRWAREATLLVIPILNPDGAARFQRRNAQGIDMNRDARTRYSPELRALFSVHDRERPAFAMELHDEDTKTRVGTSDRMTGVSLSAPPYDASLGDNETRGAAKRLCAVIRHAVEPLLGAHVARYREAYVPTSIGAALQAAGTPTVLFETGWWPQDPEVQFLRKVNFVGVAAALDAVATRAHEQAPLEDYEALPENDRDVFDLLLRGGTVVLPGMAPYRAEIGMDFDVALDLEGGTVSDVGDLTDRSARDILVAEGMFVHPAPEALADGEDGAYLEVGRPASFTVREGPEADSRAVWIIERGVARRADGP